MYFFVSFGNNSVISLFKEKSWMKQNKSFVKKTPKSHMLYGYILCAKIPS